MYSAYNNHCEMPHSKRFDDLCTLSCMLTDVCCSQNIEVKKTVHQVLIIQQLVSPKHSVTLVEPTESVFVSSGHFLHSLAPRLSWKVPFTHGSQLSNPLSEKCPGEHGPEQSSEFYQENYLSIP